MEIRFKPLLFFDFLHQFILNNLRTLQNINISKTGNFKDNTFFWSNFFNSRDSVDKNKAKISGNLLSLDCPTKWGVQKNYLQTTFEPNL